MGFQHLAVAAHTDIGLKRKKNEDSILTMQENGVFCVADGMGGALGGEMASQTVVNMLQQALLRWNNRNTTMDSVRELITNTIEEASRAIRREAAARGFRGAGTTAVILVFDARDPSRATAFHAGDSRLYRYRSSKLEQITRDHSFAEAVGYSDNSKLPSLFRNLVTRAIGLEDFVDLEETKMEIRPGDLFLLCSDGLTNMLSDDQIAEALANQKRDSFRHIPKNLTDKANQAGGNDNISIIVVQALPTLTTAES